MGKASFNTHNTVDCWSYPYNAKFSPYIYASNMKFMIDNQVHIPEMFMDPADKEDKKEDKTP